MKERQEDGRFCRAYLRTMDPERAAAEINRRDGYTMLGRKTTQQHLEQMRSAAAATVKREDILRQLAKLAFGGAEDAVRLALERGETAPEGLELSAVSELRVTERGSRSSWWTGCGRWRPCGACWEKAAGRSRMSCIGP